MSDTLGGYTFYNEDFAETISEPRYVEHHKVTDEVFTPGSHLLEINSKSGLYPLYLAYNLYRRAVKDEMFSPQTLEDHLRIWDRVVAESVFVICKTPMAKAITRRTLMGFRKGAVNMWAPEDLINKIKNQPELFIKKVHDLVGKNVKINAIVGNPPYQVMNNGNGNGSDPVYHLFIDTAMSISDFGTLIHPGRFLFNAGKTPKIWNSAILNNENFQVKRFWLDSKDVFNNVDINGGVAITFWDKKQIVGPIGFFSPYEEVRLILSKVLHNNFIPFSTIVGPRELYNLTEKLYIENPGFEGRQSKGHKYSFGANIFDVFPEIFSDDDFTGAVKVFGRFQNQRCYKYTKSEYISNPDNLPFYKVIISKSDGAAGTIGNPIPARIIGRNEIGFPNVAYTDTFIGIGQFSSFEEAEACSKYLTSKFCRALIGTLKVTQDNPKETWANVPLQDFTENSDVDWSQSVANIDRQLYKKYELTDEEITFIESMIKPM